MAAKADQKANPKHFGIDVNENKDIEVLAMSNSSLQDKVDTLINLVEEMHIVSRDNQAIFCEMLANAEIKLNKRVDDLRVDMIRLINARNEENGQVTQTILQRINKYKVEEKATLDEVRKGPHKSSHYHPTKYETITVTPIPGFVIKTKRLLGNKEKAFINVFHHPRIELEPAAAKDKGEDKPYIVINEISSTHDKEGADCLMFNIAVSSEFFRQPNNANPKLIDLTITSPQCVSKIIHKVNMKFNEFLDEANYVLPRLAQGFKGDSVPPFQIPVPVKNELPGAHKQEHGMVSRGSMSSIPEEDSNGLIYVDGSAKKVISPSPAAVPGSTPSPEGNHHDLTHHESRASMGSVDDNASIVSDITHTTLAEHNSSSNGLAVKRGSFNNGLPLGKKASARKMTRKSVFDTSGMGFNGGAIAGRNLLSGSMLEYVREECVDSGTADAIKQEAVLNPSILLGWQINVDPSDKSDEKASGIYVVTDTRKNLMSKSEFRVSRFHEDDQWIKLKRQEGKGGYNFRAMRKVLFGLTDDDDTSVMMTN